MPVTVIPIRKEDLPRILANHETKLPGVIAKGLFIGAQRGRTFLVRKSPVDTGQYKNSWVVKDQGRNGATVENDAPHAGIIEGGARPHGVNREGIEALTKWVMRVFARKARFGPTKPKQFGPTKPTKFGPTKPPMFGPIRGPKPVMSIKEARGIAFAIAAKLKKQGQKGLFIVRDNLPTLSKYAAQEVARAVSKYMKEAR